MTRQWCPSLKANYQTAKVPKTNRISANVQGIDPPGPKQGGRVTADGRIAVPVSAVQVDATSISKMPLRCFA